MNTKKFLKGAVFGLILGTVGGYLFNPKSGKKNREKVQQTAKKLIKRLTDEVSHVKNITKREYSQIVTKVMQDFKQDKALSKEAWSAVAKELDSRWKEIDAEIKAKAKKKKTTKK